MKKCPPGVICIENITIAFLFIIISIILYVSYSFFKQPNNPVRQNITIRQDVPPTSNVGFIPSYPYNNLPLEDVLLNPYNPPYKDDRYFIPEIVNRPRAAIPINISTNVGAVDTNYRQMGLLTPLNGQQKDNLLPLMGRPLFVSRSKYQYYTISNQHNNVKLPISVKGRSALNDNGVDELYNGDTVYIEGYNEPFKVTLYDSNTIKYLPFL